MKTKKSDCFVHFLSQNDGLMFSLVGAQAFMFISFYCPFDVLDFFLSNINFLLWFFYFNISLIFNPPLILSFSVNILLLTFS